MLSYVYDGTLEGLLCCVFVIYERREVPDEIALESQVQFSFDQQITVIETRPEQADRVWAGIGKRMGSGAQLKISGVSLASDPDKATLLCRWILKGFKVGKRIYADITSEVGAPIEALYRRVGREQNQMIQFIRFAQKDNGVWFAKIKPEHSVVPLIMDHFAARFNIQPFIIYDERHHQAGIYDRNQWHLVDTGALHLLADAPGEAAYQELWRTFYDAIAIKERFNPKLRQNLLPKRFWGNMCELNRTAKTKGLLLRD
jgi:probable DNA metabolism protein